MSISIAKFARLIVATSILAALSSPMAAKALDEPQSAPTVCLDKDGQIKKGEIDVLVLLDNSGSLAGKSATDPDEKRFEALDEFLTNFANISSSNAKNFGLVKFSEGAEVSIPIGRIDKSNFEEIRKQIRTKIGEASGTTNYVRAFDRVLSEFKKRPAENCKILIWFTDGGFNTFPVSEQDKKENVDKDLRNLESNFCSDSGVASSIQESDINTFVVFLGDGKSSKAQDQERINASIDAMQVITGDKTPSIQGGNARQVGGSLCSAHFDPVNGHLGEVVSASEAKDLIGYLTDIVNIADGGKSVSKEDCPVQSETLESLPMPSGWFIDWVSVTSWDGDLPGADSLDLEIKMNGDIKPFSDYFDPIDNQESTNVLRFVIKEGKQGDLKPGWILESKELGRACVRAKPVDVKFRIGGDQRIPINPSLSGGYESLYSGDLLRCFLNGAETTCSSTSGEGLTGSIKLENGEVFSADGTLPVSIEITDLPSFTNDRCVIELTGDIQASKDRLSTTVCGVVPAPKMPVRVIATELLNGLQNCGLGPWHVTVDGVNTNQIQAGSNKVLIGLESDAPPQNKNVECLVENSNLTFAFDTQTGAVMPEVMSVVNFSLIKKPNIPIAVLIAAIATAFVSMLSLLLLRAVNMLTSKTVRAQDLFGYETSLDLVPGQFQRGELVFPSGSARSFTADIDQMQQVTGNQHQTSLKFASINLVRQLPSFIKPFDESRLVARSKSKAVFWRANRSGDGLNMAFSKAVILSTNDVQPPTAERPAKVLISVLVPKRGLGAGTEGVQQLIREHGDELAVGLLKILNSEQNEVSSKGIKPKSAVNEPGQPSKSEGEVPLVPTGKPLSPTGGKDSPPRPPEPPRKSN